MYKKYYYSIITLMKNLKINKKILCSENLENYEILKILYIKYIVINYF